MGLTDLFFRRSEPRWMNQGSPPFGYGGDSPRTEIRVIMCCNKCEEKVREEIAEVYGVQEIFTDQARSEVVVYGLADAHDVVKKARKVDKRADIMATDSFTTHHNKHTRKHNRIHHKHDNHHGYDYERSRTYPVETLGSPRYNSSFNQSSSAYSRGVYNRAGYRPGHNGRPELDYRPLHDGYRSEADIRRYQYSDSYRPQYSEHHRSMYNELYRPEYEHRHPYGYRPSQTYPPRYFDDRDYRDSAYPGTVLNLDYQLDYY